MWLLIVILLLFLPTILAQMEFVEGSGDDDYLLYELHQSSVPECLPKLDLLFMMDTSGSVKDIYNEHNRWTISLTESLPVHKNAVRIAALQYAGLTLNEFDLNTYSTHKDVLEHLKRIRFRAGITRTGTALFGAEEDLFQTDRGGRSDAKKVIVLFTDGLSIDDPIKPAEKLRKRKVIIYVVCLSINGYLPELQGITGSKSRVFGPNELERLQTTLLNDVKYAKNCKKYDFEIGGQHKNKEEKVLPVLQQVNEKRWNRGEAIDIREDIQLIENDRINEFRVSDQGVKKEKLKGVKTLKNEAEKLKKDDRMLEEVKLKVEKKKLKNIKEEHMEKEENLNGGVGKFEKLVETISTKKSTIPRLITTTSTSLGPRTAVELYSNRLAIDACPLDILFILDSSGSVKEFYSKQKQFIDSVLTEIRLSPQNHQVALLQFAGTDLQKTEWSFDAYNDRKTIMKAFEKIRHFTGTTYIGAALEKAADLLEIRRARVRTLVILVSDGYSQDDGRREADQIRNLSRLNFYAISLAELNNVDYLSELVGGRQNVFVGPEETNKMKQILLSEISCHPNS